jgi:hypothetical protein
MVLSNEMDLAESRINRYFLAISAYTQYCESRLKSICANFVLSFVIGIYRQQLHTTQDRLYFYITQLLTKALKPNLENVAKGALNCIQNVILSIRKRRNDRSALLSLGIAEISHRYCQGRVATHDDFTISTAQ